MLKNILTLVSVAVLLIAAQACAPFAPSTPDPNSVNTAVAQTLAAALTQTSQPGIPITGQESPTATQTITAQAATEPPTVTVSPAPVLTSTAVSTISQISVSTPTNCRVGPGIAYERVGGLQVGEVAEVVGRNAAGTYWIIRNPDRPGQLCWLWGAYATLAGNPSALPVYTPPPTPTPSPSPTPTTGFSASYDGLESCTGTGWWVEFELNNPGGITFESMSLTVRDSTNNTVLSLNTDNLTNRNSCNETDTRDNLPAGAELIVSAPVFNYDPTGRALVATISLCSGAGQTGTCVTQAVNFTP